MEIILKDFFIDSLEKCPADFQESFRKVYQQLKIVDHPQEVKGIIPTSTDKAFFKILIGKSRIGLHYDKKKKKAVIISFLHNEFYG